MSKTQPAECHRGPIECVPGNLSYYYSHLITNVNTHDDSAALNKSPVYCVTPKGTAQSMEKKSGEGLDYLTVEHHQMIFCFAH